jgi:F-type H+-transporting ATPase subunit epsilon
MNTFKCTILSKAETLLNEEVVSLDLPGADGGFSILANHTPLIAMLGKGIVRARLKNSNEAKTFNIQKGSVEMARNHATVLVDLQS